MCLSFDIFFSLDVSVWGLTNKVKIYLATQASLLQFGNGYEGIWKEEEMYAEAWSENMAFGAMAGFGREVW